MPSSTSSSRAFVRSFLAVFVALLVFFSIGSEILIRQMVEPRHNYYKYLRLFRSSDITNAIFGDSLAAYGLTGHDGFVNLAYGGDGISGIKAKVYAYFADKQPGKVILEAGLHHFSRAYQLWRPNDLKFIHLLSNFNKYTPRLLTGPSSTELFGYWMIFLSGRDFKPKNIFLADGSRPIKKDGKYAGFSARHRKYGAIRYSRQVEPISDLENSQTAASYVAIIDFLLKRGARICLLTLPVSDDFRAAMKLSDRFARAQAFFTGLAAEKGINYVDETQMNLPDEMFDDYNHLNIEGARHLTPKVLSRCFPAETGTSSILSASSSNKNKHEKQ